MEEAISADLRKLYFLPPRRVSDFLVTPKLYRGRRSWDHRYALTHSGMPKALKEIERAGYELHVASSLVEANLLGRSSPSRRVIEILPHTTWPVLQHELQHMRGHQIDIGYGFYLAPPGRTLTKAEEKILEACRKLEAKGFDAVAVDETLAVQTEIRELGKLGYSPWSGPVYNARKYAWGFQREALEAKVKDGQATAAERGRLRLLKVKAQALRPSVVRAALGVGAAGFVYYNEELESFLERLNGGTWQLLGLGHESAPRP